MSGGMGTFAFSLAMRDTINRMVKEAVNELRPRYRYGTVLGINRTTMKAEVQMNGESGSVMVSMGSIQPSAIGQSVRVEGIGTDKFITDVIGEAWNGVRWGIIEPYYSHGQPRVLWEGDSTLSGPYPVEGDYWPQGGDTVIGIPAPGHGMILQRAFSITNNRFFPRWHNVRDTLGFKNEWQDYNEVYGALAYYYSTHPYIVADFHLAGFARNATGVVKLRGLIKKTGASALNEHPFILPEGYRPLGQVTVPATSLDLSARIDIFPDGRVFIHGAGANPWVSLDNVTFLAADAPMMDPWEDVTFQNGFTHYQQAGEWPRTQFGRDIEGIVHTRGLMLRSPNPTVLTIAYQLPVGFRPGVDQWRRTVQNSANYFGGITQSPGGNAAIGSNTPTGYVSNDGMPIVPAEHPATSETGGWRDISMVNSWTAYGGAYASPRVVRTASHHVIIQGLVKNAAAQPSGTVMGYLPAGFRPKSRMIFAQIANNAHCRVDINPDGAIVFRTGHSNLWTSIDAINFFAEQ